MYHEVHRGLVDFSQLGAVGVVHEADEGVVVVVHDDDGKVDETEMSRLVRFFCTNISVTFSLFKLKAVESRCSVIFFFLLSCTTDLIILIISV